ncbi:MAG: alpha/beta hydrolase [Chloroflexota bacterium]
MPTIETNGVTLYYKVIGDGPPLVFTHGAGWDHTQWQPQIAYFANRFRVIMWDVRGHGRSTLPDGPVDSADFRRDLVGLLDALDIRQAILVGLSMGGHISLQTAIAYPERVAALVLMGTPCTNRFNWRERVLVPINRWSARLIPMSLMARWTGQSMAKHSVAAGQSIEQAMQQIPYGHWQRIWHAVTSMESRAGLAQISCPTLILEGADDWLVQHQQAYLASHIPNATHHVVPRAFHAMNWDNPEDVHRYMDEFVTDLTEAGNVYAHNHDK